MKLNIEIKDNRFIYEYEIGENRHHSTTKLDADYLILFSELLKRCSNAWQVEHKRKHDEMIKDAIIREHSLKDKSL